MGNFCRRQNQIFALILCLCIARPAWTQQSTPATQSSTTLEKPPNKHDPRVVEDWAAITLEGSKLYSQPPLLGEKDNFPTFTRELLQVGWRPDDGIDLYVIRPKGVEKPPVILYLYSYPSETDRFRNNDYCERLASGGFAAVGFVSALTGHRYRMRPMKEWFVSELQEALGKSVHDVQMILNLLDKRGDVDMTNVAMFGTGSGATIAILAAAADPRIKAIDLLDPWGDWPDWMEKSPLIPAVERPDYVTPEFLQSVAPLDPLKWLPQLKTQSIRMQFVGDERATPPAAVEKIVAAAPPNAKVIKYDNRREFFAEESGGRVFEWVKSQLKPPARETKPAAASIPRSQPAGRSAEPGHDD